MIFYENTANQLRDRILRLIPKHPEIMDLESPWDLYKIEGFKTADLQPTLFQASWALQHAKMLYRNNPPTCGDKNDLDLAKSKLEYHRE